MKLLVTGAHGQLGSELRLLANDHLNWQFHFADVAELDITNREAVNAFFEKIHPDFCINCAAYTGVDKAETDRELCDRINVTGSQNLAEACQATGAKLLHISTDFVFDGTAHRPITEEVPTQPVNYYGLSKLNGELAIQNTLQAHFIIRTSWLYSSFGNNFVKTMLQLALTKPELGVIADQIGTPTYARDLASIILKIIGQNSEAYGVYHYSNEGTASWYDFTSAIFEYRGISIPVKPIPTEAYPTPAKRPHFSVMDKTKIKTAFGLSIPHWRTSLKQCLKLMEKSTS